MLARGQRGRAVLDGHPGAPSPRQVVGRQGKAVCHRPQTYLFVLTIEAAVDLCSSQRLRVSIVLRRISSYSHTPGQGRELERRCFNRPQTYLFVLTERAEPFQEEVSAGFQSSSDVSLRTHTGGLEQWDGALTPVSIVLRRISSYSQSKLATVRNFERLAVFQSSSDVSLRTHTCMYLHTPRSIGPCRESFNRPQTYLFVLTSEQVRSFK